MHHHVDPKDYKKKLKEEIKEYLELKNSIRKFKGKDNKSKSSKSERKTTAGLKLEKITKDKI